MSDFIDNQFYLEIKLRSGEVKHVLVPSTDFNGNFFEYTFGEIIDLYTTKFKNRDELLDDIRKNDYADIEDIPNDDISSISFRYKDNDRKGCYPEIAYSDSLDVIDYLHGSIEYRKTFAENFKRYVLGRVVTGDTEYRQFLASKFTRVYSNALRCNFEEYALGNYEFDNGGSDYCFLQYHNIRAHALINHDDLDAEFELERAKKKGKPSDKEAADDLKEAIENAHIHHSKRSAIEIQREYLGDRFIPYPVKEVKAEINGDNNLDFNQEYETDDPLMVDDGIVIDVLPIGGGIQDLTDYTVDPDEQMDLLNSNPVTEGRKKR